TFLIFFHLSLSLSLSAPRSPSLRAAALPSLRAAATLPSPHADAAVPAPSPSFSLSLPPSPIYTATTQPSPPLPDLCPSPPPYPKPSLLPLLFYLIYADVLSSLSYSSRSPLMPLSLCAGHYWYCLTTFLDSIIIEAGLLDCYQEGSWKFPFEHSVNWSSDYNMLDVVKKADDVPARITPWRCVGQVPY
ncbi:unnamed protein product, partial [Urochloa humidicola]